MYIVVYGKVLVRCVVERIWLFSYCYVSMFVFVEVCFFGFFTFGKSLVDVMGTLYFVITWKVYIDGLWCRCVFVVCKYLNGVY